MTNRCILQFALLLCFSTTALSMSYNWLRFQQRSSNLACLKLLWQLNGTPQYCHKDRMDFKLPAEIKQPQQFQKEDTVLIIHEMLRQIFDIFQRNFSSTGWNETIIMNLYVTLSGQMDRLETAMEEMEEENFTWESMTVLHLKNYYFRIMRYLETKLYSRCAWTVVKAEILRNFFFLNGLTEYLQN
ncbi:interferon beta [Pteropus vampyrus]|uniref:Interferon beta n=1 Tax=Pteropus vampyrus TaxID=132908 RepID=A0A6P3RV21_PTEVA|nr:interferon beta [Pteropus vampyrus]